METFDIDWLPDAQPIIYGKLMPDYNVRRDTPAASQRLIALLQSTRRRVPYILDMTSVKMTFSEMIGAMAMLTKGDLAAFAHPKLQEIIIISEEPLIRMGANALGQTQYGGRRAAVLPCLDDALLYLHAKARIIAAARAAGTSSESEPMGAAQRSTDGIAPSRR
jgi:hypothetical protein